MSRVSLSRETGQTLRHHCAGEPVLHTNLDRALAELDRALALLERKEARKASPKKREARKAARALKQVKRKTKAEETAEIRAAVFARDENRCVACGHTAARVPLQMDHFWPKGRTPQSVETCWTLCAHDHALKTRNFPSAAWWLERFASHALRHGYTQQRKRADDRLAAIESVSQAAALTGGGR